MDALKKAELAKRKTGAANAASVTPSEAPAESSPHPPSSGKEGLAPIAFETQPPAAPPSSVPADKSPLPSLPEHLELLDEEFSMTPAAGSERQAEPASTLPSMPDSGMFSLPEAEAPVSPSAARTTHAESAADAATDREAIQNLFETKQPPASRKTFAIAVSVGTALAIVAIGLYFWIELQPKSSLQAGPNIGNPPSAPNLPIAAPSAPAAATEPALPPGLAAPAASPYSDESKPIRDIAGAQSARPPAAVPARNLFQVSRAAAPQTDPALERGYAALNRGDTAAAQAAYEQALGNDPRNSDALSGLAVLAQRSGNPDQAADYYLRILEADPHSAFALAGLIGLQSQVNPAEAETRLKQALSRQPDSAALNFSLGNLHAAAKRWLEAQQAYFKAVATDPGNPDYLFNLAVSLDQLRQPRLAANYYAQAIVAADTRPGSFDKGKASARLQELQQ